MNRISALHNASRRAALRRPVAQFLAAAVLCVPLLLALIYALGAATGAPLALIVFVVGVGLAARGLRGFPYDSIGLCNLVTLFRFMLVSAVIATLPSPETADWPVFLVAVAALALDGVDGWLARRGGHTSEFGAVFDMEVDGVLALTLALLAFTSGQVGLIAVMLGVPMYIFRAAQMGLPWLKGDLVPRMSRKVVCVVQIAVLIVIALPVTGRPLTDGLALLTVVALVWSFRVDIRALWRARTGAA
jgi:phosphatidylglycerophosphate synthase